MQVTCNDRDRIFEDGTLAEWAALEAHAATCPLCAEEVRAWKSLSVAAGELRDYSDSPSFWPRIERALAEEAARNPRRAERKGWFSFLPSLSSAWPAALAGALVLILTLSAAWIYLRPPVNGRGTGDQSLLKSKALKEVESAETAYQHLREHVRPLGRDRTLHRDIEAVERLIRSGSLLAAVETACAWRL